MERGSMAAEIEAEESSSFAIRAFSGEFLSREGKWEKVLFWDEKISFPDMESVERIISEKSLCGLEVWLIVKNENEAIAVQKMTRIGEREYKIIHD